MIANIIRIPERGPSECLDNYWKIYEESYKNKDKLVDFVNDNLFSKKVNKDEVNKDIEQIYDVRYNFYKVESKHILLKMILSYYSRFFDSNQTILKELVEDFYKNGKVDNFLKIYLKSCIDSDVSLINKFSNEINSILKNIKNEAELIKFQYYCNKLLNITDKIDNDRNYLKRNIILS